MVHPSLTLQLGHPGVSRPGRSDGSCQPRLALVASHHGTDSQETLSAHEAHREAGTPPSFIGVIGVCPLQHSLIAMSSICPFHLSECHWTLPQCAQLTQSISNSTYAFYLTRVHCLHCVLVSRLICEPNLKNFVLIQILGSCHSNRSSRARREVIRPFWDHYFLL